MLTCPSDVQTQARQGQPPVVTFNAPVAQGGAAPVAVTCTPPSGSQFSVGSTRVTCTATDAERRAASCGFSVIVDAVPTLSEVSFLAFGDSMTGGGTWDPVSLTIKLDQTVSYPYKLRELLNARYIDQQVVVVNAGVGGERAEPAGRRRLPQVLDTERPDVLLLLHGANDLLCAANQSCGGGNPFSAIPIITRALDDMVTAAQSRGVQVLLATFPPQDGTRNRGGGAPAVPDLNAAIAQLAGRKGAVLVDLFGGLGGTPLPFISVDGLHPTPSGFEKMAEIWFDVIQREFERPSPTSAAPSLEVRRPATAIR